MKIEGRAVGVLYERAGQHPGACTGREVILTAGALRTRSCLLSGIGPADAARSRHWAARLPGVGRNLHDTCVSV